MHGDDLSALCTRPGAMLTSRSGYPSPAERAEVISGTSGGPYEIP